MEDFSYHQPVISYSNHCNSVSKPCSGKVKKFISRHSGEGYQRRCKSSLCKSGVRSQYCSFNELNQQLTAELTSNVVLNEQCWVRSLIVVSLPHSTGFHPTTLHSSHCIASHRTTGLQERLRIPAINLQVNFIENHPKFGVSIAK